jgi:hypothetical protein
MLWHHRWRQLSAVSGSRLFSAGGIFGSGFGRDYGGGAEHAERRSGGTAAGGWRPIF